MARGWESKSVEMQIEERDTAPVPAGNKKEGAELARKLDLLQLSRKRLLNEIEMTTVERLREIKRRALRHIEEQIRLTSAGDGSQNTPR